jgi:hypothetical protein
MATATLGMQLLSSVGAENAKDLLFAPNEVSFIFTWIPKLRIVAT